MRLLASLLLACMLATPAAADGVYFTESLGGADIKDELGEKLEGAGRFRAALGVRRGAWAVELWGAVYLGVGRAPLRCDECAAHAERHAHSTSILGAYGLDVKYLQPVSRHVEVYLRGGASYLGGQVQGEGHGGRGLGVGAGVQLKGKVPALGFLFWPLFFTGIGPKVTAAVWADAGTDFYRLHRRGRFEAGPTIDARLTSMSLGFAVGTDF